MKRPFRPEPLIELRAWCPESPLGIPEEHLPFTGTVVEVKGWYAVAEKRELANGTMFYSYSWFGYVVQIDKKIPESELMIVMRPHDHNEGNTNVK
jgi:hypothetical protein